MRRIISSAMLGSLLILGAIVSLTISTSGQDEAKESAQPQWEYLVVANPSRTNLTPTGNPRMRKEPGAAFGFEGFVLEQHLDKLGANGWELVAVSGAPTDPVYYFKRKK